ncbi:hypothetical protein ALC57_15629 [Trachymyrmex cornetzi]|uniref:AC9 transposase n=1 Tax=Trachymyrmex cornetzi TaxID=471704 RepID=A0A151IWJ9_9HYME|nr:hypothetical protein ALC57_15629 [Trachymyrmex cornetzi]
MFVDLQGFIVGKKFIVKEVAVLRTESILSHYIFTCPMPWSFLTKSEKYCASWLSAYHHGLQWEDGTIPYSMVKRLITMAVIGTEECDDNKTLVYVKTVDFVCTTADVWSSSKRSYLGMTIYWINSDTLKREGAAIACRRFKGAHTYDKVTEIINKVHSEFELNLNKIMNTIADNGSNMVKAFKMFGRSESDVTLYHQIIT